MTGFTLLGSVEGQNSDVLPLINLDSLPVGNNAG